MPELQRVNVLKTLGVALTNGLSVSLHVQTVITFLCSNVFMHCGSALQTIFRAVVVAKVRYGSSVWWGSASATDRQKHQAIRRRVRAGFYASDPDYDFG